MSNQTTIRPTKTSRKVFKSPIQLVRDKYDDMVKMNTFKVHFADRNDTKVIKPFLKGIHADYIQVNQVLLIKSSDTVLETLFDLQFQEHDKIIDNKVCKELTLGKSVLDALSQKLYNYDFNIEVYVVDANRWNLISTADIITNDLNPGLESKVKTFLTVLQSLLNVAKQTKI